MGREPGFQVWLCPQAVLWARARHLLPLPVLSHRSRSELDKPGGSHSFPIHFFCFYELGMFLCNQSPELRGSFTKDVSEHWSP